MANTLTHNKRKSGIHMQLSLIIVNPLGLGPKESSRIEWVWRYATVRGHNAICVYGELSQYNNDTPGYETTIAIMKTATSTLANAKSDRSLIGESRTCVSFRGKSFRGEFSQATQHQEHQHYGSCFGR